MPQLNYKELKNHIASQKLNNIYLLTGEKYLIDNFEKLITNSAINNQKDSYDFDYSINKIDKKLLLDSKYFGWNLVGECFNSINKDKEKVKLISLK